MQATAASEPRFVLSPVRWAVYAALADELESPGLRLTYDRGSLEIMVTSKEHERLKSLIATMIRLIALELEIEFASGGAMTFKKETLERGLEPDECFWITNEPRMRGKDSFDPDVDPPPDLVVEVEVSRSALDRMGIYASLGVPEVWRIGANSISGHRLTRRGEYRSIKRSRVFPFLEPEELLPFLGRRHSESEMRLMRTFREWVRKDLRSRV